MSTGASDTVIANVRAIKAKRRINNRDLAARMTAAGVPTSAATVGFLISGRRRNVYVDELVAVAAALQLSLGDMLLDVCQTCVASPPPGMVCGACGASDDLARVE